MAMADHDLVAAAAQLLYQALISDQDPGEILARYLDLDLCIGLLGDDNPISICWISAQNNMIRTDRYSTMNTFVPMSLLPVNIQNTESIYLLSLRSRHVILEHLEHICSRSSTDLASICILMSHIISLPILYSRYISMYMRRYSSLILHDQPVSHLLQSIQVQTDQIDCNLILYQTIFQSYKSSTEYLHDLHIDPFIYPIRSYLQHHLYDDDAIDILGQIWAVLDPYLNGIWARNPNLQPSHVYQRLLGNATDLVDLSAEWLLHAISLSGPDMQVTYLDPVSVVGHQLDLHSNISRRIPVLRPGHILCNTILAVYPVIYIPGQDLVQHLRSSIISLISSTTNHLYTTYMHIAAINTYHIIDVIISDLMEKLEIFKLPSIISVLQEIHDEIHEQFINSIRRLIHTCTHIYDDIIGPGLDHIQWSRPGRTRPVHVDQVSDPLLVLNLFLRGLYHDIQHLYRYQDQDPDLKATIFVAVLVQGLDLIYNHYTVYQPGIALRPQYLADIQYVIKLAQSIHISRCIRDLDRDRVHHHIMLLQSLYEREDGATYQGHRTPQAFDVSVDRQFVPYHDMHVIGL